VEAAHGTAPQGSRRIAVDGLVFRWLVRGRPTYCQALGWSPLTFVAELAADNRGHGSWWRFRTRIPRTGSAYRVRQFARRP
jgi:hypothetical protein